MQTDVYRKQLDKKLAEYTLVDAQYIAAKRQRVLADNELETTIAARKIIQDVSQALQQEAHQRIASVVSRCLETIFTESPYTFVIEFEQKRGKTEAKLKLLRERVELEDPINQAGGGVIDIAAFALRLACIILQRPQLRRLMVLDEPLKCIRGKQYRDRVRGLLQSLSKEMGIQFILCVDHEAYPQFMLGSVIEVG